MHDTDRHRLHFGPYRTPRFEYGEKVQCEVRGEMEIVGLTDAPLVGESLPSAERLARFETWLDDHDE